LPSARLGARLRDALAQIQRIRLHTSAYEIHARTATPFLNLL